MLTLGNDLRVLRGPVTGRCGRVPRRGGPVYRLAVLFVLVLAGEALLPVAVAGPPVRDEAAPAAGPQRTGNQGANAPRSPVEPAASRP